ncbi:hypothetical protein [Nonomuraea jiangxiensis]|uniref:Uncharacterized protein n=1 Tax=Nonomuraea jiangxiensis TaxID=633440 RepID=A0A1G8TXA2_9ACTN|nr:hypothetical protein [Nonomuraea jiangxiensis]SDJ46131.1 hypothetical protein SAMN05421869_110316 [Nonomuraea jiangxiensis]
MPLPVALAAALQLLLAATFLVLPLLAQIFGGAAQRAAEAEMARQGLPGGVLAQHGINFREKPWELALALAIAAALTALGWLNLTGEGLGRTLSWIAEPVVLVAVGSVTASQVFARRYTEAAFRRSADPRVRDIDVRALLGAAVGAFPSWLRPAVVLRFWLATLGSVLVIVLLLTPAAGAHFR